MAGIDDIDFGPLEHLAGTWKGDKGMDIAPEPDGTEENPYYETITIEKVGDVKNAEEQRLVMCRYLQIVRRKSNDEVFHDETGYWMWDPSDDTIMVNYSIPRAVSVLCGGTYEANGGEVTFKVSAGATDPHWNILQSPFMADKARTLEFTRTFKVDGNKLSYAQNTLVDIYGKKFEHTDENELTKQ